MTSGRLMSTGNDGSIRGSGKGEEVRVGRRILWSLLSQGLSSITNFGLQLGLILVAAVADFGRAIAVISLFLLALALSRSTTSEPLVASTTKAGGPDPVDSPALTWRWAGRRLLVVGTVAGAACGLAGLLLGVSAGWLVAVVVACPILIRQDGQRHLAWAVDSPSRAVAIDAVWVVVSLLSGAVFVLSGIFSRSGGTERLAAVDAVVIAWLVGGVTSALFGWLLIETRTQQRGSLSLLRRFRRGLDRDRTSQAPPDGDGSDRSYRRFRGLARSQSIFNVSFNLLPVTVALLIGPEGSSIMKAVIFPLTPLLAALAGLRVLTLPMLRRAVDEGRAVDMTRRFLVVGLAAAGMGTLATIVVFELVPDGEFGPTLALAREFLPWGIAVSMVYVISQILADLAGFALRPPVTVGIRLTTVGLEWAGIFIGALHGPAGLVAGWAVGLSMATLVWLVATFSPIEISSVGRDYAGPVG